MGRTRASSNQRFRFCMWIATVLWLIGAIAAVIDRDTLNAAAGALTASGSTERSRGLAYLALGLVVAAMAILIGVFLAD
jgi:formate hydrogenlyase subunit 3/multisubunit Na+/H+ antiporter MnhD subunit